MELIKANINIDFIGRRKLALLFSALLIFAGIVSLVVKGGPLYGIDFAGGTVVQVKFTQPTKAADIKAALKAGDLGKAQIQQFGDEATEFLIRMDRSSEALEGLSKDVQQNLVQVYGDGQVEIRRVEMVGPQVGKDLRVKGIEALLWAMLAILAYITLRFEFRFAIGAIVALVHDVAITLGAFSLFGKEIDLPIIAAFLAIIGYSLNDTIIVYDRIRENMARYNTESFPVIVNRSINETLSRTILTSFTTLIALLSLYIFGGEVIRGFTFAMIWGIVVGTYSSICIASPLLLRFGVKREWSEEASKETGEVAKAN